MEQRNDGGGKERNTPPSFDATAITALIERGQLDEAAERLKRYFVGGGADPAAHFLYAKVHAARGDLEAAVATLSQPVVMQSEAALPALGQSADWLVELGRPHEAERRYRELLERAPQATMVHRALAEVLLRAGRAPAAVSSLRTLCRSGNVTQSELAALVDVAHALALPTIGPVAEARQAAAESRYQAAVEFLESRGERSATPPDVEAFHLRMLAEAQQFDALRPGLVEASSAVRGFAGFWSAVGIDALARGEADLAAGALLRALELDASDSRSIQRLRQAFRLKGITRWDERLEQAYRKRHNAVLRSNEIATITQALESGGGRQQAGQLAESMERLAGLLEQMGRRLEATLWRSMAAHHRGDSQRGAALRETFARLSDSPQAFPTAEERRLGLPPDAVPERQTLVRRLKQLRAAGKQATTRRQPSTPSGPRWCVDRVRWTNIAAAVGLDHRYRVASSEQRDGFAIYQQFAGGVAVADFDRDGRGDLYFAQGGCDPPAFAAGAEKAATGNRLYRNLGGRVVEVASRASAASGGYTLGVSAGDWNQDGFDDLLVNRFGAVELLTNRGDGTFASTVLWRGGATWMPTSIALADVDGDGHQDLVALGYADREMVFLKPPRDDRGRPTRTIGPSNFAGAENRVCWGTETGWAAAQPLRQDEAAPGTSLGIIVGPLASPASADGAGPAVDDNQIFIGNDQQNNRLWTVRQSEPPRLEESATVAGCAFGNYGTATAAMGISAADLDQNGHLDLFITNYQNEPVSLYLGSANGFRDRTVRYGLLRHSIDVLGFGCAPVDVDLNGWPDLVVANGHVDDATETEDPFEQPMQLFALREGRYRLIAVEDPSGYWRRPHVGRALARLDFNGDGRDDLAITHLNEPAALLVNRTVTENHWIRLHLVGTESPRLPIGSRVRIAAGGRVFHHWLTAGDGYLCRDEPVLSAGLGPNVETVNVAVTWPSGKTQVYPHLKVDQDWQLTEHQAAFGTRR